MPSRRSASSSARPSGLRVNVWPCASASAEKSTEEQREAKREGIHGAIAQQGRAMRLVMTLPCLGRKGRQRKRIQPFQVLLMGNSDLNPSLVPSPGPQLQQQHHLHQHQHVTFATIERQPCSLPRAPLSPEAGPSSGILAEGERLLLLLPVQLCGSKPAGLSRSCSSPQPIQDADPSTDPFFTPPAAPPQPPQEASSLAPPIFVDTHMQAPAVGYHLVNGLISHKAGS
ncbi:hypothetical protein JOM56_012374 [Amanita muscaria]